MSATTITKPSTSNPEEDEKKNSSSVVSEAPLPSAVPSAAPIPQERPNNARVINFVRNPPPLARKESLASPDLVYGGPFAHADLGRACIISCCIKKGMKPLKSIWNDVPGQSNRVYRCPDIDEKETGHKVPPGQDYRNITFFYEQNHWRYSNKFYKRMTKRPLIGHIVNQHLLCDKGLFVKLIKNYYYKHPKKMKIYKTFFPESYVITYNFEKHEFNIDKNKEFLNAYIVNNNNNNNTNKNNKNNNKSDDNYWIFKVSTGSLGSGVFIWTNEDNDLSKLQEFLFSKVNPISWLDKVHAHDFQISLCASRYINNPLLYKHLFKHDLRVYLLICKCDPCLAYFHKGKCRLSTIEYDSNKVCNGLGHITNAGMQKSHENFDGTTYTVNGNQVVLLWDEFLQFMFDSAKYYQSKWLKNGWFEEYGEKIINNSSSGDSVDLETIISKKEFCELVHRKIKRVLGWCLDSVCESFDNQQRILSRVGQFAFLGCDIMIDDNGLMWILEFNKSAAMKMVGKNGVKEFSRKMLHDMVDITCEIRDIEMKSNGKIQVTKHSQLEHVIKRNQSGWEPIVFDYYKHPNPNRKTFIELIKRNHPCYSFNTINKKNEKNNKNEKNEKNENKNMHKNENMNQNDNSTINLTKGKGNTERKTNDDVEEDGTLFLNDDKLIEMILN